MSTEKLIKGNFASGADDDQALWTDWAKCLCLPLIIYSNVQRSLFQSGYVGFSQEFHLLDSVLNSVLYPTIAFCYGWLLSKNTGNDFSDDRNQFSINKIFHLYIVWSLLQVIFNALFSILIGEGINYSDFLFPLFPIGHFSFMFVLFLGLQITFFSNRLTMNKSVYLVLLFFLAGFLYLGRDVFRGAWVLADLWQYLVFILLGLFVERCLSTRINFNKLMILPAIIIFISAQYYFHETLKVESYETSLNSLLLSLVGIFFMATICLFLVKVSSQKVSRLISLFGVFFLPLYAMHMIPGHGGRVILNLLFKIQDTMLHLVFGLVLALCIPIVFCVVGSRLKWGYFFSPLNSLNYTLLSQKISVLFENRPYFKKVFFTLGASVASVLIFVFAFSEVKINQQYDCSNCNIYDLQSIEGDASKVEGGRRISRVLGCYYGCHGIDMTGNIEFNVENYGLVYSKNITNLTRQYSERQIEFLIRYGLKPDGKSLSTAMPSTSFYHLSQSELEQMYAFFNTFEYSNTHNNDNKHSLVDRFFIAKNEAPSAINELSEMFELENIPVYVSEGERLAKLACSECHGVDLNGTDIAPNLAISRAYNFEQFQRLMKTGIGLGDRDLNLMTQTAVLRFSFFTDEEVEEIFSYLNSSH